MFEVTLYYLVCCEFNIILAEINLNTKGLGFV